jgi:hypothetical protein
LKAVADDVEAGAEHYSSEGVARILREIVNKRETLAALAADPNVPLATDIRAAYYDDGAKRTLADSVNPKSWLRLAAAAREFIAAEQVKSEPRPLRNGDRVKVTGPATFANDFGSDYFTTGDVLIVGSHGHVEGADAVVDEDGDVRARATEYAGSHFISASSLTLIEDEPEPEPAGPRVFNVGDAEPEDRDTIKLRGVWKGKPGHSRAVGTELLFEYRSGAFGGNTWHQVSDGDPTGRRWQSWLELAGPLTEVLPEPVPEPRVFNQGDVIPDDVQQVVSSPRRSDGRLIDYTRRENDMFSHSMTRGYLSPNTAVGAWEESDFPLTEVLPEVATEREPRVFPAGSPEPEGVDKVTRAGSTWFKCDNGNWTCIASRSRSYDATIRWQDMADMPLTEVLA